MAKKEREQTMDMIPVIAENKDIKNLIYVVRGQQVMLDSDLAMLYQVETKVFNQAVNRNIERFPENFRFQLTKEEFDGPSAISGVSSSNRRRIRLGWVRETWTRGPRFILLISRT